MPPRYTRFVMPRSSKLKLPRLPASDETPGQRLARIRRERGFTQIEPAGKTSLVSDYERGKLRFDADGILRFAKSRELSNDALLQPAGPVQSKKNSRKVLRRLELIEALPPTQETALLRHMDSFLEGAARRTARRA